MMMPHAVSKKIKRLVYQLEVDYGDYSKYTDTLDRLHTVIINDAQSFKPKQKRHFDKKKKVTDVPESTQLVGAHTMPKETT